MFRLSDIIDSNRPLTASLAAWLYFSIPDDDWAHPEERTMVLSGIDQACQSSSLPTANRPSVPRRDPRLANPTYTPSEPIQRGDNPLKVFTDYEYAKSTLESSGLLVDDIDDADYLLTASHIKDFLSLRPSLRVCQFPYEGNAIILNC